VQSLLNMQENEIIVENQMISLNKGSVMVLALGAVLLFL
jgi:hypothetical protein